MKTFPLHTLTSLSLSLPLLLSLSACENTTAPDQPVTFELLTSEQTGVTFSNDLTPDIDLNIFRYMYFYNGGGLGVGDLNNDGLPDLVFTGNQVDNKLYLNQGDLSFRDVTDLTAINQGKGWATGVSLVDINNDGMLDIYVNQIGDFLHLQTPNRLFVCQGVDEEGIPQYVERASEYGLDQRGFSTQSVFFDYDLDGDLDLFQLNHSVHSNGTFGPRRTFAGKRHPQSGDRLFQNQDGSYVDVTQGSGIQSTVLGYGLGVVASDINLDGYPDLYVANDFHENDYLYLNQGDGTFSEEIETRLFHTSRFSMGVDIADLNRDGHPEIVSLDMHPEDPEILKRSEGEDGYDVFSMKLGFGYNHQYARNSLQLNRGNATFSEIGMFAGVHATDWSWAPLIFDYDADGTNDLFITNGIPKRMNDIDFINFASSDSVQDKIEFNLEESDLRLADRLPEIKLANKLYRGGPDLLFEDLTGSVAHGETSYSTAAAYADLDLDGDLDLVVANTNQGAFIYRNDTDAASRSIRVRLSGPVENPRAIGAKVMVSGSGGVSVTEKWPVRGFQSSMETDPVIAIGDADSLTVVWPDGTFETTAAIGPTMDLRWSAGLPAFDYGRLSSASAPYLQDALGTGLDFKHEENPFVEFNREPLMPHMVSREGPALVVGDVTGDGLDDVFVGGAKLQAAALFVQTSGSRFVEATPDAIRRDSLMEDVAAVLLDVELDGDLDLFVGTGGNEFRGESPARFSRLYLNDGQGGFSRSGDLPPIRTTVSHAATADLNGNGYPDLVVAGRAVPWKYGEIPQSHVLINQKGTLKDVTNQTAPGFEEAGLVTGLTLTDINGDNQPDIVAAIEWGPISAWINDAGTFSRQDLTGEHGFWSSLMAQDLDDDGDMDLLAGNLGRNSKLKPTPEEPVRMYYHDFDDNGSKEQFVTYYLKGREIPLHTKMELERQMPLLKKKFLYASDMARADIEELVPSGSLRNAESRHVDFADNAILENTGDGFVLKALPPEAQFTSYAAGVHHDLNGDGLIDLLLAGNTVTQNIQLGRQDADMGLALINRGSMTLLPESLRKAALTGPVKRLSLLKTPDATLLISAVNGDSLRVYRLP